MSVDDNQQVVRAPMDRTLREEGESPSSPQELAAGDFYGNPPVVHGPVYRVDVAVGQDDADDDDDNDNDLYSDDEEGDGPFEDEDMAYIPSYIQGLLLDESSDLVVRYFEHSVSEVQGLVEDDDDDTYEGGEEEEEVEEGEEDIHEGREEAEGHEEEEDTVEEHGGGSDEYSEVESFQDEYAESELTKEEDVEDRRTVDEFSESCPGDEDHSINSQHTEEWHSGGWTSSSVQFISDLFATGLVEKLLKLKTWQAWLWRWCWLDLPPLYQ